MNEFDRINNRFELLIRSANRGDRRSLTMAKRAAEEMKAQIEIQYFNRSGPRVLRRSYALDGWLDNKIKSKKGWN